MKKLNLVLLLSLGLISAGCSNNDTEVKALQEQLTKLEQQLNESEEQAEEKAECAFCGKEDYISNLNVRTNSEGEIDYYYCDCQYVSKETKEKAADFVCPVCGGVNTCPEDSECLNPPKDPDFTCSMCGKTGTCTETDCFSEEYAGCRNCGKSIWSKNDYYELGGTPLCLNCYNAIKNEAPNGYCTNPDCGMPLESSGYCDDCGDAYVRFNCESCGKEFYAYELDFGICMDCQVEEIAKSRTCPVPGCGGDADYCDCPSDLQEKYREKE